LVIEIEVKNLDAQTDEEVVQQRADQSCPRAEIAIDQAWHDAGSLCDPGDLEVTIVGNCDVAGAGE
jgi:hypothetical protein